MALFLIEQDTLGLAPRTLNLLDVQDLGLAPRTLSVIDNHSVAESFNPFFKGPGMLAGLAPIAPARLPGGGAAQNLKVELYLQGVKIDETLTSPDGSWVFYDLQIGKQYDVVARHPNLESIISTKRVPGPMPLTIQPLNVYSDATHSYANIIFKGGFGPYDIEELSASPFVTLEKLQGLVRFKAERQATEELYIIRITPTVGDYEEIQITVPSL